MTQPETREIEQDLLQCDELWLQAEKDQARGEEWRRIRQIALAMVHGYAVRCGSMEQPSPDVLRNIDMLIARVREDRILREIDLCALEEQATRVGLSVANPEEIPTAVEAYFGYVDEVDCSPGESRLALYDESDTRPVHPDPTARTIDLPVDWRKDGAGIALVRRIYPAGVVERFEPASARE